MQASALKEKSIYFILAVSGEFGVEALYISPNPIDSPTFCMVFDQVLIKGWNCFCIWDNAKWHDSFYTRKYLIDRRIDYAVTVPWTPQLNLPAENAIGVLKAAFNKLRLKNIINNEKKTEGMLLLEAQ